jgi:hypothetical protein
MTKVRTEIELDEILMQKAEEVARDAGRSIDVVIEDAVRERLHGGSVSEMLPRVEARSGFAPEQNLAVAQAQAEAVRVEREALGSS